MSEVLWVTAHVEREPPLAELKVRLSCPSVSRAGIRGTSRKCRFVTCDLVKLMSFLSNLGRKCNLKISPRTFILVGYLSIGSIGCVFILFVRYLGAFVLCFRNLTRL